MKLFASNGNFESSPDYGRIVNEANFDRVQKLVSDAIDRGAQGCVAGWLGKIDALHASRCFISRSSR